jgi:hypothetical protein
MDKPLPPPEPVAEQRAAGRVALLLRAAKLVGTSGEYLCILRDVSAGGIKLRLFHPLPDDAPFALELGNGARYPVAPVWAAVNQAGFRFVAGPVDIAPLLCEPSAFPRRPLRFAIDLEAIAMVGGHDLQARLLNLSQDGARFSCERRLALAQPVQLDAPGLPPISARVRWRDGCDHGVAFERRFGMEELSRLLAAINRPQSQPIPARMAAR